MNSQEYIKMDGQGNVFLIFDNEEITNAQAIELCANEGADGIVMLSSSLRADIFMRIINADGSESAACGNATRCVAYHLGKSTSVIETSERLLYAKIDGNYVTVNMGKPLISDYLDNALKVDMGNPHVTFITKDIDNYDLNTLARNIRMEEDEFPDGVNVGIGELVSNNHIKLRVDERGVGETKACGTGACAAFAVFNQKNLVGDNNITISLPGGDLTLGYNETGEILMSGEVRVHE